MRKIVSGIVFAVFVLVGVGSYSLALRAQQRVEQQLTGAFAALRNALGSGAVGKVEFDLGQRSIKVSDVNVQLNKPSGALLPSGTTIKVRELSATGIDFPADWRVSAEKIEALDVEISGAIDLQPPMTIAYKVPRITITDYSGPIAPLRGVDSSSPLDAARLVLEHLVASAATSVTIPTITATVAPATPGQPMGPISYTYTGFALHDIRAGRIAQLSLDRAQFSVTTPPNVLGDVNGEIGRSTVADFDAGVLLAVLAPAKDKEDRPLRLQGRSSAGPYSLRFDNGVSVQIAATQVDNVTLRPSKLRFAELADLVQTAPSQVTPNDIADLVAGMYEGIGFDLFEIRGVTVNMPQMAPYKLGAFRLKGLANGKLAEIAMEGAEGQNPLRQDIKIGRAALIGLDIAGMIRVGAQFSGGREPSPDKLAMLLPLIEGVEIKDVHAPSPNGKAVVDVDTFAVSWGQFVGPIPTAAQVTSRFSGPIIAEPEIERMLASAGITTAAVNFELRAAWTEATHTFAVAPASIAISNLFSLGARVAVGNVPREMFSPDPNQAMLGAAQVEAGLFELELRDAGALDLAIAQFARQQGLQPQAARQALIDGINQGAAPLVATNPDLQPAIAAIGRFIGTSRGALTLRVIPKGRVPIMSLVESAGDDPAALLSHFRIDVTAGP